MDITTQQEYSVIDAIVNWGASIAEISGIIRPQDFSDSHCKEIYTIILDMAANNGSIDFISVCKAVEQKGKKSLSHCLLDLALAAPIGKGVAYHCRQIKAASQKRELIKELKTVVSQAESPESKPEELLEQASQAIFNLSGYSERKSADIEDIQDSVREWHRKVSEGERVCVPNTGLLKEGLPGYYPGHFWVLSAYTSVGKSTWLNQQIIDICRAGGRVLVFTLEDSREEKLMGLQANVADIYKRRLIEGNLDQDMAARLKEADKEIARWPLWIYDDVDNLEGMRLLTKKHIMQTGIDFVAIDYAQLIHVPEARGSLYEQMRAISKFLFRMGLDLKVCVEALSQENNEGQKSENRDLIKTKGGGDLAAAADIVIELSRKQTAQTIDEKRKIKCRVRKNRKFGQTGAFDFCYSEKFNRIIL